MKSIERINIENFLEPNLGKQTLLDEWDDLCLYRRDYWSQRNQIGFLTYITEKSAQKADVIFEISGQEYHLPAALGDLQDAILKSQYILDLEDDWDDMEAKKVEPQIYHIAIKTLIMYAEYIYKNFDKIVISVPEINPVVNGTIDFSWRTPNAKLLLNVKEKDGIYFATCYGNSKDSAVALEGIVDIDKVDQEIASWMKKLKT